MIDWTQIIVAVIGVLSAALTGILIPYIKNKLNNEQLQTLDYWLRTLIAAAEETLSYDGQGKKAWVLDRLKKMGFKFDKTEISNAIDGLCRELTATSVINTGGVKK